ncbi:MAG: slr1601 family putative cell division protein [Cyanobacteriota bacterium]
MVSYLLTSFPSPVTPKFSPRIPARRVPVRGDLVSEPRLGLDVAPEAVRSSPPQSRETLVHTRPRSVAGSFSSSQAATVRAVPVRSRRSRSAQPPQDPQAWEVVCRIGVNVLFTAAAISGLYRLLPVQLAQYHRLQVLEQQIEILGMRVSRLQDGLDRGMDPMQQEALIKERLNKVPANQIQVRLVDPSSFVAGETERVSQTWIGQSPESLTGSLSGP